MQVRSDRQEAVDLPQFHAEPHVNRLIGPPMNASLRFDDAVRNPDEAVAPRSWSAHVGTARSRIPCLDGDKKNRMASLVEHHPDSKDRLIGNADRMHGNRRLFGRSTKKISRNELARPRSAQGYSSVPSSA
jgi:hypothetical protein